MARTSARYGARISSGRIMGGLIPVAGLLIGLALPGGPAAAGPQSIRPITDTTTINAEYAEGLEERFRAACEAREDRASCQHRLEALQQELGFEGFALAAPELTRAAGGAPPTITATTPVQAVQAARADRLAAEPSH